MIPVTLAYPNGNRETIVLAGVPQIGDHVRRRDDQADSPSLVVESVLWIEIGRSLEPSVILVVRPHRNGPFS